MYGINGCIQDLLSFTSGGEFTQSTEMGSLEMKGTRHTALGTNMYVLVLYSSNNRVYFRQNNIKCTNGTECHLCTRSEPVGFKSEVSSSKNIYETLWVDVDESGDVDEYPLVNVFGEAIQ